MLNQLLREGALFTLDKDRLLLGFGKKTLHPIPPQQTAFYFPDFFLTEKQPWSTYETFIEVPIDQLLELLENYPKQPETSLQWEAPQKHIFCNAFRDLKKLFASGQLQKAVPYLFATAESNFSTNRLVSSLINLLKYGKQFPVFLYGYWNPARGLLGATPEFLFSIPANQPRLLSMACAATAKGAEAEKLSNQKNSFEHQIVVQILAQKLFAWGAVTIGTKQVVPFGQLSHLITPIEVHLEKPFNFNAMVTYLHPTPALGAFPEEVGRRWLLNYQTIMPRFHFGAPVGFQHQGAAQCYVAIRNLQWIGTKLLIGAGCGVVTESEVDEELKEILDKINSIKEILQL
jgi:menaquinone-specific isochorismate synthase